MSDIRSDTIAIDSIDSGIDSIDYCNYLLAPDPHIGSSTGPDPWMVEAALQDVKTEELDRLPTIVADEYNLDRGDVVVLLEEKYLHPFVDHLNTTLSLVRLIQSRAQVNHEIPASAVNQVIAHLSDLRSGLEKLRYVFELIEEFAVEDPDRVSGIAEARLRMLEDYEPHISEQFGDEDGGIDISDASSQGDKDLRPKAQTLLNLLDDEYQQRTEIKEMVGWSGPTVTKYLQELENLGKIVEKKQGKNKLYKKK